MGDEDAVVAESPTDHGACPSVGRRGVETAGCVLLAVGAETVFVESQDGRP